jgi:hypothetical protein
MSTPDDKQIYATQDWTNSYINEAVLPDYMKAFIEPKFTT